MYKKITTLTEFILKEERQFKNATGNFTLLLTQIENATKIIASHLRRTGLTDLLGATGGKNVFQDEVQKLDEYSNNLMVDILRESGQVYAIGSEELPEPIFVKDHPGEYSVFFDPIDGSSNIDTNMLVGTIFSIYHKDKDILQPGNKQVAAGYIIYGPTVMFVYTAGSGVNGFTLDPAVGSFLLSHPDIKIPETGSIYSINEGNSSLFDESTKRFLNTIKNENNLASLSRSGQRKLRYAACLVADIHQILLKGGIFLYPKDKQKPHGKLRLLYEVNPMAYIINQAGGLATSDGHDPLSIKPESVNQRAPVVMGSKHEVEKYLQTISKIKIQNAK